jgi:hypothetical protein
VELRSHPCNPAAIDGELDVFNNQTDSLIAAAIGVSGASFGLLSSGAIKLKFALSESLAGLATESVTAEGNGEGKVVSQPVV